MNVTGKTKIFRHENENGRPTYSRQIASKKFKDGHQVDEWMRVYEKVQLPKGTELPDKAVINVTKAFEAVTEYEGKTYRKLVVQEFGVEPEEEPAHESFEELDEDVPF